MRSVRVVCAVIVSEGRILATQRGYGDFKGRWEFPGGKIEPGETPEQALVRELREELNARVAVGGRLCDVEHDYPGFHLSMSAYLCTLASDHVELLEHNAARWLGPESIDSVDWLPADPPVIAAIKAQVFRS